MNIKTERDIPREWPSWVEDSLNAMGATETNMVASCLPKSAPPWTWTIAANFVLMMHPTVTVADFSDSGPRLLGKMVGHFEWLALSENGIKKQLERFVEECIRTDELLRRKISKKAFARMMKRYGKYGEDFARFFDGLGSAIEAKAKAVEKIIALAEEQSFSDKVAFNEGRVAAETMDLIDDNGGLLVGKSTSPVYFLLLCYWRFITCEINDTTQLHNWMTVLLGQNAAGSPDRFRMLCYRLGVKLKPRGRPKGRKNTTRPRLSR